VGCAVLCCAVLCFGNEVVRTAIYIRECTVIVKQGVRNDHITLVQAIVFFGMLTEMV